MHQEPVSRDLQKRGIRIQSEIREVLYRNWDPIGVSGEAPNDEYDAYIGGIYRLLTSTRSVSDIAEHLQRLETEKIGVVPANLESLVPIAKLLLAIEV